MGGELDKKKARGSATGEVLQWLLDGDPAIRWQTLRDLSGAGRPAVERERRRVGREGWGRALLEKQDGEGTWAGGLYTPKWTSTTYTMLLLRDLGLPRDDAATERACALLLDGGLQNDGGINYGGKGTSETCITGMALSILAHFEYDDTRLDTIAEHLFREQMPDGGWNCRRPRGATHSSVNTTISVLEALHLYEQSGRARHARSAGVAQRRGREFLLVHQLFRSHRTGAVINPVFLRLSFPPRWHYDILRALDHFRSASARRDERLAEAVEIVRTKRGGDGRWSLESAYSGKSFFNMERVGEPSRWNTLRALRVLRWWEGKNS